MSTRASQNERGLGRHAAEFSHPADVAQFVVYTDGKLPEITVFKVNDPKRATTRGQQFDIQTQSSAVGMYIEPIYPPDQWAALVAGGRVGGIQGPITQLTQYLCGLTKGRFDSNDPWRVQ
jgi:hypothetical protein